MSAEHSASPVGEDVQPERRRSTTVIMNANVVTMPPSEGVAAAEGVRRTGSMRRRLSKQNATIEEPISLLSISDPPTDETIEEHPEEDDATKLRPPTVGNLKKSWTTSKSLSRESTGTEYSDRSGTDLRGFVDRTLHKSEEDRKQLLEFEKELKEMIGDEKVQSKKYELPSSYHRMLLHRCAAWFGLDHNVTNKHTEIVVNKSDRTKIPEESFSDYIRHDNYCEGAFTKPQRNKLLHMESLGEPSSQFGSQASLNHDLLMMRRAQSFDVAAMTGPPVIQSPPVRGLPIRQLSLNCQPAVMGAGGAGHQWAPQRSFDCSNNSYLCTAKHPIMRKAESFGGMAAHMGYEQPMVCQTPPSVMVHHHHHHGYPVYDEMGSPNYPEPGMCSPGGTYYEYVPQPYHSPRGVRYMQRPQPQYIYTPPQYVQYPQQPIINHPEVIVDPVQAQPFPPVGQFVLPTEGGYSSSHQAEQANSFIKASIDGGYGSMNQETEVVVEKAQ